MRNFRVLICQYRDKFLSDFYKPRRAVSIKSNGEVIPCVRCAHNAKTILKIESNTINFLDCESVKKCCVLGIGNGETLDVFGMVYEIGKQENRRGDHSYYDDAILRVFNKNLELVYEPIAESFHLDDDGDFVIRMRCLNG